MTKKELEKRIQQLNEYMLSDTDKKLLLLKTSSIYTYNKAIALINKDCKDQDWYAISNKNYFKSWSEAKAFLDGLCLAKNTNFKNEGDFER